MTLNYPNGQLIGALTGSVTKFLSHENKIADICKQTPSNEPIVYRLSHDDEMGKTTLHIKTPDGKELSHSTKYAIGETIEIEGSIDAFFRRYRTAHTSPTLRFAFMPELKTMLKTSDANTTYYMRITDIKPVHVTRIHADYAYDLGVHCISICKRKCYYIPNFDTDSITFYSTAHRAMMALAYQILPQNIVLNNHVCLIYEFELLRINRKDIKT
jgi:hypothetical protein